jgi:hypothetical protein
MSYDNEAIARNADHTETNFLIARDGRIATLLSLFRQATVSRTISRDEVKSWNRNRKFEIDGGRCYVLPL